jgi:hypothetical protein
MPTSDDLPELLIDTSVAVALAAASRTHPRHQEGHRRPQLRAVRPRSLETFSVLDPPAAAEPSDPAPSPGCSHTLPGSRFLSAGRGTPMPGWHPLGIAGGAVYDAPVAAAAARHGITLAAIAGPPGPTAPSTSTSSLS